MKKTIIENFEKNENEIKVALLKEIKEEFENYKTSVLPLFLEDIGEYNELEELLFSINPLTQDKYCQLDGTAAPCGICYKDKELILTITGEGRNPDRDYVTLEEPTWSLSVGELYNLLLLLQHPTFKEIIENDCEEENEN